MNPGKAPAGSEQKRFFQLLTLQLQGRGPGARGEGGAHDCARGAAQHPHPPACPHQHRDDGVWTVEGSVLFPAVPPLGIGGSAGLVRQETGAEGKWKRVDLLC